MPIVQVRTTSKERLLSVPIIPIPKSGVILGEWQNPHWSSELIVYPPNYMGYITPQGWDISTYLLNVADSGEQAEMTVGSISEQSPTTEGRLYHLAADELRAFGATALIDSKNSCFSITSPIGNGRQAIGGLILHTSPPDLKILRNMFAEIPVELAG